jgi:hypothetical protein
MVTRPCSAGFRECRLDKSRIPIISNIDLSYDETALIGMRK